MNARKSIFIIASVALLASSSLFSLNQHQKSTSVPSTIADGTRPMPPLADGTRPMPPLADGTRPMPPLADGTRPMPPLADGTRPMPPLAVV
jgi:hypothetical protein